MEEGRERMRCSSCGFVFYQNAKPTSSVIIVNDKGEVLLGRRGHEPHKGQWDVIGGFLEVDEHPETGAKREAKEETGTDVDLLELLGVFMDVHEQYDHTLNFCYIAHIRSGELTPNQEINEFAWFGPTELPEIIAFKNGRNMLNAWLTKQNLPSKY